MQPSIAETLLCVLENLEQMVFPQLAEEHAQSVARCTSILLRVVLLRLENEPALLATDSAEKRALFTDLAERLAHSAPELHAIAAELDQASRSQALPLVTLADLTEENDSLKRTLERGIVALHQARPAIFADLQSRLRGQLRAQIDRELTLVHPPYAGPGFPY